ncbi:MAG: metallophosphoesterase [Desulfitobacteriaceae bacterium]
MKKHSILRMNKITSRRSFLRSLGGFFASHWLISGLPLSAGGILAWAEHDTRNLTLEMWDLYYPLLPESLEGITIAQITDLHLESLQIKTQQIVEALTFKEPDLLVITGDIISTRSDLNRVMAYLDPLQARFGRYVVMGNNDYSHFSHTLFKRYFSLLRNMGWVPLLNEAEYIAKLNLWVIGIDDPATAHDDVPKAYKRLMSANSEMTSKKSPGFRLALAHSTDCLDDVSQYGADLLLTGHTHGGQIRLPGLQPFMTNTYLGDEGIYEGYHVINGVPLYINRGLGESVIPFRFNVPPEIAFFTLHKGSEPPGHRKTTLP